MSRWYLTRWLFSQVTNLIPAFVISAIARILGQLAAVVLLVMAAQAVMGRWSLWLTAATMVVCALLKAGLRYLEHYAGHWLAFSALERLRSLFFSRLIPQAPQAVSASASSEMTARATSDIDKIEVFFAHTFPPAISGVLVPIITLLSFGVWISWPLAGIIAIGLALITLLPFAWMPVTYSAARRAAAEEAQLNTHLGDSIHGIREVLSFKAEQQRLQGLDEVARRVERARSRTTAMTSVRELMAVVIQLGILVAVVAAGEPWQNTVLAIAVALALALPSRSVDDFVNGLDSAFAAAERIHDVIEAEPRILDGPGATPQDNSVELKGVTLHYEGTLRPALSEFSCSFAPGEWSAVVGVSGSGKSSVAALIMRGWDPNTGQVLLGGEPLDQFHLDDLRQRVALASQHPVVLRGTVASNLRLANPKASDEQLRQVLDTVALDVPLDSSVSLSGGQLQRLSLARALLVEPQVLILDEALSQLDAATATTVRANLRDRARGVTIIEITHRTDLLPTDTFVTVLDAGHAVESGRVSQLRGAGGAFDQLEARVG